MADNFDMKQFLTENQKGPYAKNTVKENRTAEDLFQMFKDEDLVDDRREYDEEDLMSTYPGLSEKEAEKLFNMLQNINEAKYNSYADVVNAISKKYSYKVYHDEIEEFMQDKASLDTIMAGKDPIAAYEEFYNIQRESLKKDEVNEAYETTIAGDTIKGTGGKWPDVNVKYGNDGFITLSQKINGRTSKVMLSKKQFAQLRTSELNEESVRMFKSDNPEGDQLVLRFLKGIATKFDYPVQQAALFVKERIKKLGY